MLRTIVESQYEFNNIMQPYIQVNVMTSGAKINLQGLGIGSPEKTLFYTPPYWVGPESVRLCQIAEEGEDIKRFRKEVIPSLKEPYGNYLVCDDYLSEGDTMEIATIRLLEAGVNPESIWVFLKKANRHKTKSPLLDSLLALNLRLKETFRSRRMLVECTGLSPPRLETFLM